MRDRANLTLLLLCRYTTSDVVLSFPTTRKHSVTMMVLLTSMMMLISLAQCASRSDSTPAAARALEFGAKVDMEAGTSTAMWKETSKALRDLESLLLCSVW